MCVTFSSCHEELDYSETKVSVSNQNQAHPNQGRLSEGLAKLVVSIRVLARQRFEHAAP